MKVEGDQANVKNKDVTPIFHKDVTPIFHRFQNQSSLSTLAKNIPLISAGSKTGSEEKEAWR